MKFRHAMIVLAGLTAAAMLMADATAAKAEAPWPWYPHYNGYSVIVRDRRIPYFAEFPPVYYSYIVPRPYGWGPNAYPPHVLTPQRKPVMPATIINPFVPQPAQPEEKPKVTIRPRVMVNPFVAQGEVIPASQR